MLSKINSWLLALSREGAINRILLNYGALKGPHGQEDSSRSENPTASQDRNMAVTSKKVEEGRQYPSVTG